MTSPDAGREDDIPPRAGPPLAEAALGACDSTLDDSPVGSAAATVPAAAPSA